MTKREEIKLNAENNMVDNSISCAFEQSISTKGTSSQQKWLMTLATQNVNVKMLIVNISAWKAL